MARIMLRRLYNTQCKIQLNTLTHFQFVALSCLLLEHLAAFAIADLLEPQLGISVTGNGWSG